MVKKKASSKSKLTPQRVTIITGYAIYGLLILYTILSVLIPWGLLVPRATVNQGGAVIFALALTAGMLAPGIIGYIIGDKSVRTRGAERHHFNGVLFGFLSYWLSITLTSYIGAAFFSEGSLPYYANALITNGVPIIIVAAVSTLIAVMHVKSTKASKDVIEYAPFQVVLLGMPVLIVAASFITVLTSDTTDMFGAVVLPVFLAFFGTISYYAFRKAQLGVATKLTWIAIAITVLWASQVALSLVFSTLHSYLPQEIPGLWTVWSSAFAVAAVVLGVVVWSVFVTLISKGFRTVKAKSSKK